MSSTRGLSVCVDRLIELLLLEAQGWIAPSSARHVFNYFEATLAI